MLDSNIINYFSKKTLLIVEDHYPTRDLLKGALEMLFKKVLVATNGIECLEQVKYQKPDLIITDIQMPLKDGLECIEEIRFKHYKLPIIVISAYSDDTYLLKAANLNIQGYLLKPLDIGELEKTLAKIYNLFYNNLAIELTSELFYDFSNSKLNYNTDEILLTKKENDFFKILIDNKNKIVSYEELEYELWGRNDEVMSINSLRTLVKKLRTKIPINVIKNISKTGYKISLD